jgi:MFS family permease
MDTKRGLADAIIFAILMGIGGAFFSTIVSVVLAIVGKLQWGSVLIAVVNSAVVSFAIILLIGIGFIILVPYGMSRPSAIVFTAIIIVILCLVCINVPIETGKQNSQLIWKWTPENIDPNTIEQVN